MSRLHDFGRSDDPRVQFQLDRLSKLSVPQGRFGLDTMRAMMERLGNPHRKLPPVFHVAGTNGKGSTCAFLRAILEAQGYKVHVTTSPHLVRYNERIRVAGKLIENARLAELLEEVLDHCEDLGPSFFEVTVAAAFTEFARVPADACIVEVGLGGRLDATNVLEPEFLAACGIAALGLDHERFLLAPEDGVPKEPMARIGFEKAGIAKRGVPLVVMAPEYPDQALRSARVTAQNAQAILIELSATQQLSIGPKDIALRGQHQSRNAALAKAMLAAQTRIQCSDQAIVRGLRSAIWPARIQLMAKGPLTQGRTVWLDGGHNASAAKAVAAELKGLKLHLIIGMLENKDPTSFVEAFGDNLVSTTVVPITGHDAHPASAFGPDAMAANGLESALHNLTHDDLPVLIAGSLYLAGEALRLNDEIPD